MKQRVLLFLVTSLVWGFAGAGQGVQPRASANGLGRAAAMPPDGETGRNGNPDAGQKSDDPDPASEVYPPDYPGLLRPVLIRLGELGLSRQPSSNTRTERLQVGFVVGATGQVRDVKVIKGIGGAMDDIVRRGIERSFFTPGWYKDRRVSVRLRVIVEVAPQSWAITEILPTAPPSADEALRPSSLPAATQEPLDPQREEEIDLSLLVARYLAQRQDWDEALSRLLTIYTVYPQYSRIENVVQQIGDVLTAKGEKKLAAEYYKRLTTLSDARSRPRLNRPEPPPSDINVRSTKDTADTGDLITLESTLVNVTVTARDLQGAFVTDLRKEEFTVFENRTRQEIAFFARAEEPLMIALLLDTSGSTVEELRRIQDAAIVFVNQLRDQDRVSVVSFSDKIRRLNDPTTDREQIHRAIRQTWSSGNTRLYDAVFKTLIEIQQQGETRSAVVLLTDGVDTRSAAVVRQDVLGLVEELGVPVYPIRYDTFEAAKAQTIELYGLNNVKAIEDLQQAYQTGQAFLQQLAELTGGTLYQANTLGDLPATFAALAEELRHLYSLGYYPSNTRKKSGYQQIRVQVQRKGVQIQSRKGYYAR